MPPKKQPVKSSTGSTSSKPVNAKSSTAKSNSQQLFHGKKTGKAATAANKKVPLKEPSKPSDAKAKKTNVTQDELAAIKIQCFMRKTLARKELGRRKKEKEDYEELIEKLQRQAWLEIVQREREEAEKERQKEEEERKRLREEAKRKQRVLEAAFDGDTETIINVLAEAKASDMKNAKVAGPALDILVYRHLMRLIESEDAHNNTALSEAGAGGNSNTIQFLIDQGADVNSRGRFNRTPLYRAAFGGHLEAVEVLLQSGADPRLYDNDGNTPLQVAAVPTILEILKEWDISETDRILEHVNAVREKKNEEERKLRQAETKRLEDEINEAEKDFKSKQRKLQKTYEELNKRIYEHDKCMLEGQVKTEITLQAVHDAEAYLATSQIQEKEAREKLAQLRLKLREQNKEDGKEKDLVSVKGVKCHIKELDDVLLRDVGGKIKADGRWPLVVDPSSQAATFLRYRDTNYLNALRPNEMEPDIIRKAILGAIRYGKFAVFDMMEVDMLSTLEMRFNEIQNDLFSKIISKDILKDERYLSLIKDTDGEEYSKTKFMENRVKNFSFIIITKMWDPPEKCYAIRKPNIYEERR